MNIRSIKKNGSEILAGLKKYTARRTRSFTGWFSRFGSAPGKEKLIGLLALFRSKFAMRLLIAVICAALGWVIVAAWNTWYVAINAGWNSIPETRFRTIVAYPGYDKVPSEFWMLVAFSASFVVAHSLVRRNLSLLCRVLTVPLMLANRIRSGGYSGIGLFLISLAIGFALAEGYTMLGNATTLVDPQSSYQFNPMIAAAGGLALLVLACSSYLTRIVLLFNYVVMMLRKLLGLANASAPVGLDPARYFLLGVSIGMIFRGLDGIGVRADWMILAAVFFGVQFIRPESFRCAKWVVVLGPVGLLLAGLLDSAQAVADDATWREENFTWDNFREWSETEVGASALLDVGREVGEDAAVGGASGAIAGGLGGDLEEEEEPETLAVNFGDFARDLGLTEADIEAANEPDPGSPFESLAERVRSGEMGAEDPVDPPTVPPGGDPEEGLPLDIELPSERDSGPDDPDDPVGGQNL